MDSYSDYPNAFSPAPEDVPEQLDVAATVGGDERRMHVRAYNSWCALLNGRDYPSIADLGLGGLDDFGSHSVLLDFSNSSDNPLTVFIGPAIREECGLHGDIKTISDVPGKSLLSRLTDHYLQIVANRAPVGFEAEFVNQRGHNICYRGILMPFSKDADTIDFIYGVINWKDAGEAVDAAEIIHPILSSTDAKAEPASSIVPFEMELDDDSDALELTADMASEALPAELAETAIVDTEPSLGEDDLPSEYVPSHAPDPGLPPPDANESVPIVPVLAKPGFSEVRLDTPSYLMWEDGPLSDHDEPETSEPEDSPEQTGELREDSGLADYLCAARESAEVCKQADGRSRVSLYRTLAIAYDFAIAAKRVPADYLEILDDAGVKTQARAPMTPIVKLVFGVDYDKTRLTEFAAALSYAERMNVDFGEFQQFVEQAEGGLKGLVAAERKARRPDRPVVDKGAIARDRLRHAAPLALADLPTNQEFALVLTRRNAEGVHEIVQLVVDDGLLERALTKSAR